ncbi:hypothetical protein IEQ34_000114 [Dendrobium chrysotoxum]|uniref:Uncharacterized protein n=1 Tax=Dendrobium chrysotoxum TaxID=161865 RepID=A0AAV7HP20_DENCH|nr:hypothetical protein IEQ34_000114 [Dendrobium chrysotoxum]
MIRYPYLRSIEKLGRLGKLKDLPAPLHVREEDIMRILKIDRLQIDLEEAQPTITQHHKDQKAFVEKVAALEAENNRFHALIAEEAALSDLESSRDRVQEARDHIYEVEVKALEQQCINEGFIWGFLKGVHPVQRKTGVKVEGLTPSQALGDRPLDFDGDEIESELQKAFAIEVDDEIVDIE